jgi:pilus assembly protein CpaB
MLLAFLLAMLAAAAVYFLLAGRTSAPESVTAPSQDAETVPVVVAARDIPADTTLTEADVEVRQIPGDGRHPEALIDPAAVAGKVTNTSLILGEQVLAKRLLAPEDALPKTFAREVPPGYRAITLNADEVKTVGGLVQPGDRVDVVGYFEFQEATGEKGGTPPEAQATATPAGAEPVINQPTPTPGVTSSKAAAVLYVVQDVEVLSVAQALTPGEVGVSGGAAPADAAKDAAADVAAAGSSDPVARPDARSITLLVPAADVSRLMLAINTVPNDGSLRLVLRSPGDTGLMPQQPVVTGGDPAEYQFGDVAGSLVSNSLQVVTAEFVSLDVLAGEDLEFSVTVKNISGETIEPGIGGAPDGFTYPEDSAWDEQGFFEDDGNLRIGLNVAGAAQPFPWRWTLNGPLEPGQEATITGGVTLEQPTTGRRFWFGIIQEPDQVLEDGLGVATIRVSLPATVRAGADGAAFREEPLADAPVAGSAAAGADLRVIDRTPGWYQVETPEGRRWVEASAVEPVTDPVPDGAGSETDSGASAAATPVVAE